MKIVVLVVVLAYASAAPHIGNGVAVNSVLDERIIGGAVTTITKHPWQVSVQYLKRYICSGSIISKDWVITAAHCTAGFSSSSFTIRAGSSYHGEGGTIYSIERIDNHDSYNPKTHTFDIAVIKVAKPFPLTTGYVTLPTDKRPADGANASVAGWGVTVLGGDLSKQLRVVYLPIVSVKECQDQHGANAITNYMICAGAQAGGRDRCDGDGGSPLILNNGNILVGIASWGKGCGVPQLPGVYTNVGELRPWIKEKTTL